MADYFVYEGPADKLDLSQIFGPDKVLYPAGSPLVPAGEQGGEPVEFNADELEELRTNPALSGHRFRQLPADQVKEMQATRKAAQERRERLAKAREKAEAREAKEQGPQVRRLLNGTPVDLPGAEVMTLDEAPAKRASTRKANDSNSQDAVETSGTRQGDGSGGSGASTGATTATAGGAGR